MTPRHFPFSVRQLCSMQPNDKVGRIASTPWLAHFVEVLWLGGCCDDCGATFTSEYSVNLALSTT